MVNCFWSFLSKSASIVVYRLKTCFCIYFVEIAYSWTAHIIDSVVRLNDADRSHWFDVVWSIWLTAGLHLGVRKKHNRICAPGSWSQLPSDRALKIYLSKFIGSVIDENFVRAPKWRPALMQMSTELTMWNSSSLNFFIWKFLIFFVLRCCFDSTVISFMLLWSSSQ